MDKLKSPIQEPNRHRIEPTSDGRFQLVTWKGYILRTFDTKAEAESYYARHCPN